MYEAQITEVTIKTSIFLFLKAVNLNEICVWKYFAST